MASGLPNDLQSRSHAAYELGPDSKPVRRVKDIGNGMASSDSIVDGIATLASPGTPQQLSATSVPCKRVFVQVNEFNTGDSMTFGSANVVAAQDGTRRGRTYYRAQGDWFYVSNLNLLYFDGLVAGDKVQFYAE